jgi:hypothetical protein
MDRFEQSTSATSYEKQEHGEIVGANGHIPFTREAVIKATRNNAFKKMTRESEFCNESSYYFKN